MTSTRDEGTRWRDRTIEIKVWKILATLVMLPVLVFWFMVVHQNDEILALSRNEVVTDSVGQRFWVGSFVNTNERVLRDVAVTVDFLDRQDRVVAKAAGEAAQLSSKMQVTLRAALPTEAVRLRIYSVQWRMGRTAALMGPFRQPWEFGYLMVDTGISRR